MALIPILTHSCQFGSNMGHFPINQSGRIWAKSSYFIYQSKPSRHGSYPKRWIKFFFFFCKSKTLDILPKTLDKKKKKIATSKTLDIFKIFFCQIENAGYLKKNFVTSKTLDIFQKKFFYFFCCKKQVKKNEKAKNKKL